MEVNVKAEDLLAMCQEIAKRTFRVANKNEIALIANDDGLHVLRHSHAAKAHGTLHDVDVKAGGGLVLLDYNFLRFMQGNLCIKYFSDKNVLFNSAKIRLSLSKLDDFEMLNPPDNFHKLPDGTGKMSWILEGSSFGVLRCSGRTVEAYLGSGENVTILGWAKGDDVVLEKPTALPTSVLKFISDESGIALDGYLWLRDKDIVTRQAFDTSPWDGSLYLDLLLEQENVPFAICQVSELKEAFEYIKSLSTTEVFKQGLADMGSDNGIVEISAAAIGSGQDTVYVDTYGQSEEAFSVRCIPDQFIKALNNLDSDEVRLEMRGNGTYLTGENISYAIARIYRKENDTNE